MQKVLIISDRTSGGAAIACRRLVEGLRRAGDLQVQWMAASGDPGQGAVVASGWPGFIRLAWYRWIHRWSVDDAVRRRACERMNMSTMLRVVRRTSPSLINLHNIHDGLPFETVCRLPSPVPLVWTLHDMWPLTGYCCHSYDCRKYLTGCRGECPQAGRWGPAATNAETEWTIRDQWLKANRHRITFVSPSRWLAKCARERLGPEVPVEYIPNGLDTDIFHPVAETTSLARSLGLPERAKIILTGAHSLNQECKGLRYLVEAIRVLREKWADGICVVVFGCEPDSMKDVDGWVFIGSVSDERLLNLYYNAADLLVAPSLADNLPNVLLEATAAGTICVTTDAGGCPEVVRHGVTGFVARRGDAQDLAAQIDRALRLSAADRNAVKKAARTVAVMEYDLDVQAKRCQGLYDEASRRSRSE